MVDCKPSAMKSAPRFLDLLAILMFLAAPLWAAAQDVGAVAASPHDQEIIEGIRRNDAGKIGEAGRSGNPAFVPFLQQSLRNCNSCDRMLLRRALARLGDPNQLQGLFCQTRSRSLKVSYDGWLNLVHVGGWFSISMLEPLLGGETPYSPRDATRVDREFGRDEILRTPRQMALIELPQIVPNSPFPRLFSSPIGPDQEKLAAAWKEWITSDREVLTKLPPTGEGVDLSDRLCEDLNRQSLLETIENGSADDLIKAGMIGDPVAIPPLRAELRKQRSPDIVYAARMALAMLGEPEQLQRIVCQTYSRNPKLRQGAISDLELVNGGFSFELLQRLLKTRAQKAALRILPGLASKVNLPPPTFYAFEEDDQKADIWKDWIAANKEALSMLQPTAEGVDFSCAACRSAERGSVTGSRRHEK